MLSFIDVSGDPFSSPEKSRWIVASTVFLKKECLDEVNQAMHRLKRDILGNERIELKATDLINASTLNNPNLNKSKYLDKIISDCIYHYGCFCAAVIFENTGNNIKSTNERLPKHYRDLLWRIEAICRYTNTADAIILLDNDSRKIDKNLAFAFTNYMYRNESAVELKSIIPVPIFADSEMTMGLQLADIVAGILRKYYALNIVDVDNCDNSLFAQRIREYAQIITKRSINNKVGRHKIDGIYLPISPYNI